MTSAPKEGGGGRGGKKYPKSAVKHYINSQAEGVKSPKILQTSFVEAPNGNSMRSSSVPGEQRPHGGETEGGGRRQLAAVLAPQRALQLGVSRSFLHAGRKAIEYPGSYRVSHLV